MGKYEKYMHGANDSQKKILKELDDLSNKKIFLQKRLKEEDTASEGYRNLTPQVFQTERDLKEIEGRINKVEKDARKYGIIIIKDLK